jgi:hypothetical protein
VTQRRRCTGRTKAGKPCKAPALRGRKHCRAHDPAVPDADRFGSPEQAARAGALGGRPRKSRVVDVLREQVEADAERWLRPLERALDAERDGEPDHSVRLRAVAAVLDRVAGRPRLEPDPSDESEGGEEGVHWDTSKLSDRELGVLQDLVGKMNGRDG